MFETEEKRREIQKEIERAQQLLADAHEVEDDEMQSKPDEEYNEGEELLKVCFLQLLLCWFVTNILLLLTESSWAKYFLWLSQ